MGVPDTSCLKCSSGEVSYTEHLGRPAEGDREYGYPVYGGKCDRCGSYQKSDGHDQWTG